SILLFSLSILLAACVYRQDIPQGNFFQAEDVAQLEEGMTREQVQYVRGTPMIADIFHPDRWDYVFLVDAQEDERDHYQRVTVFFEGEAVVRNEKEGFEQEVDAPTGDADIVIDEWTSIAGGFFAAVPAHAAALGRKPSPDFLRIGQQRPVDFHPVPRLEYAIGGTQPAEDAELVVAVQVDFRELLQQPGTLYRGARGGTRRHLEPAQRLAPGRRMHDLDDNVVSGFHAARARASRRHRASCRRSGETAGRASCSSSRWRTRTSGTATPCRRHPRASRTA